MFRILTTFCYHLIFYDCMHISKSYFLFINNILFCILILVRVYSKNGPLLFWVLKSHFTYKFMICGSLECSGIFVFYYRLWDLGILLQIILLLY